MVINFSQIQQTRIEYWSVPGTALGTGSSNIKKKKKNPNLE